ncbi:hypothetical protein [Acidithiobacillus ferrianus]|uniref:hypothetical protein n=1 Tax=Acidithiobacillus ferrianus TaxID=2678518 RepID=UPI0034E607AE
MNISADIFREYDIRGVVDRDLTPELVENLGRAIGSELIARGGRIIAVGRDGRLCLVWPFIMRWRWVCARSVAMFWMLAWYQHRCFLLPCSTCMPMAESW